MTNLKFYWNGMKANGGKLQRCFYSEGQLLNHPAGTITIYAKGYVPFCKEIHEAFVVENNSDMMTDYFENDCIRVHPDHPLYQAVKGAIAAHAAHYAKRFAEVA